MPSKIQVDQIAGATGSTVTLPSGQTLDLSSGTVNLPSTALSALNASNLTSGTVPSARLSLTSSDLPTVPTTKGGTGLTTIGTASQVLRVNSGATGLEFATPSSGSYVFLGETSATNVATVDLNGYFTSDYDYYEIYLDGVYGSSNAQPVYMQFATTGSYTVQTSDYYSGVSYTFSSGTSSDSVNGGSAMRLNQEVSNTNSNGASFKITLYNPNSTTNNKYMTINFGSSAGNITAFNMGAGAGVWKNTTAITGMRFYIAVGNIYARKIKIYGVKNT